MKDTLPNGYKIHEKATNTTEKPKLHCDWCQIDNYTEDKCFAKKKSKRKTDKETTETAKTPRLLWRGKTDAVYLMRNSPIFVRLFDCIF
jgi:hypothetical protein